MEEGEAALDGRNAWQCTCGKDFRIKTVNYTEEMYYSSNGVVMLSRALTGCALQGDVK